MDVEERVDRATHALYLARKRQEKLMKILAAVMLFQLMVVGVSIMGVSQNMHSGGSLVKLATMKREVRGEKEKTSGEEHGKEGKEESTASRDKKGKKPSGPKDPYEGHAPAAVLNPIESAFLDEKDVKTFKRLGIQ
ncbi:MAG: hypothetical protein ACKO6N_24405 [Myxococcota bacterium]